MIICQNDIMVCFRLLGVIQHSCLPCECVNKCALGLCTYTCVRDVFMLCVCARTPVRRLYKYTTLRKCLISLEKIIYENNLNFKDEMQKWTGIHKL